MAGGGQIRPMGGQAPLMRRGGTEPQFQAKFGKDGMPAPNTGAFPKMPGVDFISEGGARIPQDMGGTGQMYADPRGPVRRPGAMNDNSPESLAISNSYNQSLNQASPLAPQGNFNVNQAAAGGLQQAMLGTQQAMGYRPQAVQPVSYQAQTAQASGYRPSAMTSQGYASTGPTATGYGASTVGTSPTVSAQNVQAGQLAGTNLGAYTNPFESQVVDQALGDIERSRKLAQNQLGAQATASNAYGGSRQGIAEAETNRAFAEQAAKTASGLRQAGYTQAQQMALQDIGTAQQAALANQQANLAAGTTTAGFGQQSNLANQAALNQAGQFGASAQNVASQQAAAAQNQAAQFGSSAANQAAAANMAAQNQAAQFGSTAANQMSLANQAALNQAGQFGATQSMSAQLANQAAAAQANQQNLGAAAQMGALGQQAFGTGQAIQQQQAQQGLLQQGIQQALIDAAKQQYAGYTGAPAAALNAPLQALGVAQQGGAKDVVQSQNPGLFSYLQTAAMLCWVAREVYGEQDPKWMQFREWVIGHSPDWFYKAYSNYGEKFAKVVRKVPAIKIILRPFMDAKRKSIGYKA